MVFDQVDTVPAPLTESKLDLTQIVYRLISGMRLKPGLVDKLVKGVLVIVGRRLIVVFIIVVTECRQHTNIFKVFLEEARQGLVRLLQLGVSCIGFLICDVFVVFEIN